MSGKEPGDTGDAAGKTQPNGEIPEHVRAQAEEWTADATLAAGDGDSPQQTAARERVVRRFFELHLPERTDEDIVAYLATVDLSQPVKVVANPADTGEPAADAGQPQHLLSERYAPQQPGDPVYALRSMIGHAQH